MLAVIRGGVDFYGPNVGVSSFVDPNLDPVGSETFNRIRIRIRNISFWIRAAPDPGSFGSEMKSN